MSTNGGKLVFRDDSIENHVTNGNAAIVFNYYGYGNGFTQFRDSIFYNGKGSAVMFVDGSSSSVGIGTTGPATILHVKTSGNTDTGIRSDVGLDNNVASTPTAIFLNNIGGDTGDAVAATFGVGGTDRAKIISGRYSNGGYIQLQTANTSNSLVDRVRIDNGGNVGIGTTNPQVELHVKGNNGWGEVRIEGQAFASGHGGSVEFYSEGTA
jgi:hypothetical protein